MREVTLEHVTHTYQPGSPFQAVALSDVSLVIRAGEFVSLIGHTGSGKSTLVQHLNGLLTPTSGRVLIDGRDIHEKGYPMREARQKIGLVFQYPEHQLFEETVAKDVAFGPKNLGLSQAEIQERVREALLRVNLSYQEVGEKSPFELSGGQMRRVALAGVLAMRPEMLVLDEPAAGLDPQGREDMLRLIAALHRQGATIVMVSHSMDDVARFASRAVVMEKGRLAMDGTPQEIFAQAQRLEQMGVTVQGRIFCGDSRDWAYRQTLQQLYLLPDLDAIVVFSAKATVGAAAAVKYLRRDVAIVGTDVVTELIECIEDGTVSATIVRNSFGMGYLGVEYAAEALRGNAVPDERTLASVVVTRDNLFTAEIEKIVFPYE